MGDEKTSLIKRSDFRYVEQQGPTVECCGLESSRLARVPVIKTLFRKKDPSEAGTFSSSFAVFLSMLGAVVGTGNIWRFPRIVANHSTDGGGLAFLIVWFAFLWVWSIPIILIEYGVGRFTKKSTVESFYKLIGPSYRFMGGFQAFVGFALGSYYSVLVGWCGYYFIHSCAQPLPPNISVSNTTWNDLQAGSWPVFYHGLAIVAGGISVSRGVSTIEPVNKVIVPVLLFIITFSFYWAIFLPNASEGIIHMFTPNWNTLKSSSLWLDAITQNAWDTGAGLGTFLTFATFMRRSQGAVKLGAMTPFFNNVVSLMCGILVFSTVFSVQKEDGLSQEEIVQTLQYNGEGNTGLTFIWMPLLYGRIGGGRFLAIIYFICLTFAGLSSLISLMELPIHVFTDYGFKRLPTTIALSIAMFLVGTISATDPKVLVNQDSVWAYAMILSGSFLLFLVARYNPLKFRKNLYNNYGIGDWPLPIAWVIIVVFIAPIEAVGLLTWWIVDEIRLKLDTWWQITVDSLATVLTEWAVVMLIFIGLNWWMGPLRLRAPRDPQRRKILGFFVRFTDQNKATESIPQPKYTPKLEESETSSVEVTSSKNQISLTVKKEKKEKENLQVSDIEL